ncbi:trehalose-phosphatase [Corynebacterium sanguinis]|uniref:Trehalose 6-phosphate phosphatase n=1 Tax=Corynebacterium sanguinis TaxID=2594913 RepID=A0A6C1TY33_9CORY|nr:trehalose-phosphatase [Corynebacterium sanguinis]MCT1804261.1 trehalose-phosphatase [Corynebacterium sanguinis]MCT2158369.1 trehalose-phosphatase [Corynebacterium sanguinis]MCT2287791.1 trehalose-phosphatase [Corynebacterium sanguinis]TVS28610.1 trehalose-phosphatase [Corynebacterium sanguinis]
MTAGHRALANEIERIARADTLLVCLDFDGTICELSPDAYAVTPNPEALRAARTLMALPGTQVAVLSGRHLEGLRRVVGLEKPVVLVGSHGAETTAGAPQLAPADRAYLDDIARQLEAIATPPAFVESKPYQRVIHVAALAETDPELAEDILARARALATPGRPVLSGHNIVEFSAIEVTKGSWLREHKKDFAATLFAGDDTTDETALRALGPADLGIKVGPKPTVATHRVAGVDEMAQVLTRLAEARRQSALG